MKQISASIVLIMLAGLVLVSPNPVIVPNPGVLNTSVPQIQGTSLLSLIDVEADPENVEDKDNDDIPFSYAEALELYDLAEEASQSINIIVSFKKISVLYNILPISIQSLI